MSEHKMIQVVAKELDGEVHLVGPIGAVIQNLTSINEQLIARGFQNLVIENESRGYDGAYEVKIYAERLETNKEFAQRMEYEEVDRIRQKKVKEKKEKEEIALLKKLQKKYGKVLKA